MRLIFDGFEIDREACQLFRDGVVVPLEPRVFDLLCYFVAHPKRMILKDELLAHVWQARSLSDGVLANALTKLRKALGQSPDAREPLETVRGRGYYFHATPRGPTPEVSVPAGAVHDQFVGRGYVLAQLMASLDRAASGTGQLFVVAGEPGIGKTRALSEFDRLAEARGFRCWWGATFDGDIAPAYWPWIEILRAAHQQLSPNAWQRVLPASRAALAQLAPELGTSSGSPSADAQTLRFKLFEEVTWLLRCAAREAPRVVILEDLHAADLGTIDLLASVSHALARSPVLFLATVREPAGTLDAQRAAALGRLTRNAQRLELQGLSKDDVAELARARQHSARGDTRLIATLYERTQGNPLFVCQLLALLEQRGALSEAGLRSLTAADLPPAIHGVIQQRISALEASSRNVLSVAAVAGMEFDADLVATALGDSVEHVLSALEPALELRVLDLRSASTPRRFAFAHVLLRDSLAATLGIAQLGRVHGQLAQAQLARGVAGDPRHLAEVARHLLAAVPSQLEASGLYCRAAAEAARRSSGFEVASELLSRLVQKHEDEGGEPLARCELLLTLAVDQLCSGAVKAAWTTLQRGAELAGALNAASMLARVALQFSPWSELGGGDESYVRSIVARALDSLDDSETDLRAGLLALRARLEQDRPLSEREALLDEAERLAERNATPDVQRRIALDRVLTSDPVSLSTRRAALRFRELDAQQRAPHADPIRLQQTFRVEWYELVDALTAGELASVDAATARCRSLAHGAKIMMLDSLMLLVDAGRAHGTGKLDELETLVQRLTDLGSVEGSLGAAWIGYATLLAYERGALPPWVNDPQAQQQMLSRFAQRQRVHAVAWAAWLAAQSGAPHAAAQLLAELGPAAFSHMPRQRGDLCSLCALAETYALIGDRAGAVALMPQLEPFAASYAVGFACEWRGAVAHYLGLLAALLGDSARASAHFTHAEALHEKLRMPLHLARSRAERARLPR